MLTEIQKQGGRDEILPELLSSGAARQTCRGAV